MRKATSVGVTACLTRAESNKKIPKFADTMNSIIPPFYVAFVGVAFIQSV